MDSEALQRRMVRLKKRRTVAGKPDEYLELVLEDALDHFFEVTHRRNDPGECIDGLVCELANHLSNMEGVEYTQSAGEGDMSRAWQTLPDEIYRRMLQYRQMVGVNAELDV